MLKKFLVILLVGITALVFAGQDFTLLEDEKVFLYLYSENCGYCVKFEPIYKNVQKNYQNRIKFVKLDINKPEGRQLAYEFGANYVPFVALLDTRKRTIQQIAPSCLLDYKCSEKNIIKFIK